MIDRVNNTWQGGSIEALFKEFESFTSGHGIGPGINWLIDQGHTVNGGRSSFHIRKLRDRFYQELATDYVARITEQERLVVTS